MRTEREIITPTSSLIIILCTIGSCLTLTCAFSDVSASNTTAPLSDTQVDFMSDYDLFPLNVQNIIGFVVAFVGLCIAAGGGVGGGGILVPTYILLFQFPTKVAIPLSNVTIFGGAIANFILNLRKRHPDQSCDRPVIDMDLVMIMEPVTIVGALVGAVCNKFLPASVITFLLILVLSATTNRTLKKWAKLRKMEKLLTPDKVSSVTDNSAVNKCNSQQPEYEVIKDCESETVSYSTFTEVEKPHVDVALNEMLEYESQFSFRKALYLFLIELGVVGLIVLKGTDEVNPFHVSCGSGIYILIYFLPIAWIGLHFVLIRTYYMRLHDKKIQLNYTYLRGDIQWDSRATLVFPAICSFAGVVAGCFGIGGGIVKGPLMLEMEVRPEVASATSAFMILFTTSSALVIYMLYDEVLYRVAWIVFIMGFVATMIGQLLVNYWIKKTNQSSVIVLMIGLLIGISTAMMGYESIDNTVMQWNSMANKDISHFDWCE